MEEDNRKCQFIEAKEFWEKNFYQRFGSRDLWKNWIYSEMEDFQLDGDSAVVFSVRDILNKKGISIMHAFDSEIGYEYAAYAKYYLGCGDSQIQGLNIIIACRDTVVGEVMDLIDFWFSCDMDVDEFNDYLDELGNE